MTNLLPDAVDIEMEYNPQAEPYPWSAYFEIELPHSTTSCCGLGATPWEALTDALSDASESSLEMHETFNLALALAASGKLHCPGCGKLRPELSGERAWGWFCEACRRAP